MSLAPCRRFVLLACAVATVSITVAPVASADGADSTIAGLKAKGYDVQINWVNGFDTEPLSTCTVTAVDNPDSSAPPPGTVTTVYVDVTCPNHQDG
jgi:uncharacterized membrane protein